MERRHVRSTSRNSAEVEDISLGHPTVKEDIDWEEPPVVIAESQTTRKVLRSRLVRSDRDGPAKVSVKLVHQRRGNSLLEWVDDESVPLSNLLANTKANFELHSSETEKMFSALRDLYRIADLGIPWGEHDLVVIDASDLGDPERALKILKTLFRTYSEEALELLLREQPDLPKLHYLNERRRERRWAVELFREQLESEEWLEDDWDHYFRTNKWILGNNLTTRLLSEIGSEVEVRHNSMVGSGAQKADRLMMSEGAARFTVLIEIKTPGADLVRRTKYRNASWMPGEDIAGGVVQLQAECQAWANEVSREPKTVRELDKINALAIQPKGILVVGHLGSIRQDLEKLDSFELFRRQLWNPEIITFDELLAKAEYMVEEWEREKS